MKLKVDRRKFLQFTAGGALGAATSGVTLEGISQLNAALAEEEVHVPNGPEQWKPGLCWMCPAACGLRVRMIGERAVKIQGNPLHPVSRGGLCPKGIAGLQELYHPERLRVPLRNAGTRSAPRWQEVSWEDALAEIAGRLRKLKESGQAHTVGLIDRPQRSLRARLLERFLRAYGSPNYMTLSTGLDALQAALFLQQGVERPIAYDLENTRYVLSFGVDLLEGWGSPISIMRAFGRWRDSAAGRRTKFVQVESRLSPTAAKADQWVALNPGTEAALALGIAYVLISEGLFDAEFVRERTFGFEDWTDASGKAHLGFRTLVLSEYRLNRVAEITGVSAEIIMRLAREFGQNRPGIALGDQQTSTLSGNPYAAMAVHSLNALVGSLDVPGGVLVQPESPAEAAREQLPREISYPRVDASPEHAFPRHHISRLPRALSSGKPYRLQALLLHETNPVFSEPNGAAFRRGFESIPFIVSWATFLDESAALADYVLPAATGLERWQDAGAAASFPNALQAIAPPILPARHQARDPGEVLLALARELGGSVAAALPYESMEQYLRAQSDALFGAQTGSVFAPGAEQAWHRLLEASGWWAPAYSTADELWEQIKERGGWWEPTYYHGEWERVCRTPSRRFEFYSQALARWSEAHPQLAQAAGLRAGDDHLCLPHQPPLPQPTAEYPLLLMPIEVLPLAGGSGAHLPYLQQIAGEHLFAAWDSWLEVHPHTALRLGIGEGDRVWIESAAGRVRARVRLYEGARPGVVHLPVGYGRTQGPEWARRGADPLALIAPVFEPVSGLPETRSTFVKVYRS